MCREYILETEGLTKSFGGLAAVDGVGLKLPYNHFKYDHLSFCGLSRNSLKLPYNHFKSVIGPNGAGKTTVFNLISGILKPGAGRILFKGTEITALPPHRRVHLGMGRSFQITNIFPGLSTLENIRIACQSRAGAGGKFLTHFTSLRQIREKALELLEMVHLADRADVPAGALSHGDKRKLELAILLGTGPELLLLDEPTAGMSHEEVPGIMEIIKKIKAQGGRAIMMVEHKMDLVLGISDSVTVLQNGRVIADGAPADVMQNELVQSAYLGGMAL